MLIKSIMTRRVKCVKPVDTARRASLMMVRNNIGSVLVREKSKAVGIITEHDIMKRVVASGKDPDRMQCRKIMSAPLRTIDAHDTIDAAVEIMAKKRLKRLVVTRDGDLVGIVTATDILKSGEKIEMAALRQLAEFFPVYLPTDQAG